MASAIVDRPVLNEVPPELSPAEACEIFDLAARRYVGMAGSEFLAAWDQGDFLPYPDNYPGVAKLALLLPLVQR